MVHVSALSILNGDIMHISEVKQVERHRRMFHIKCRTMLKQHSVVVKRSQVGVVEIPVWMRNVGSEALERVHFWLGPVLAIQLVASVVGVYIVQRMQSC